MLSRIIFVDPSSSGSPSLLQPYGPDEVAGCDPAEPRSLPEPDEPDPTADRRVGDGHPQPGTAPYAAEPKYGIFLRRGRTVVLLLFDHNRR